MADAPSDPAAGELYYDTDDGVLYAYSGTAWGKISAVSATGGTPTTYSGYKVHTFLLADSGSDFVVSGGTLTCDILIVAGGGGGGAYAAAGGGAGGVVVASNTPTAAGTYTVTVGAGGSGGTRADSATFTDSTNGGNSSVNISGVTTAIGGGNGGSFDSHSTGDGRDTGGLGGSGGGSGSLQAPLVVVLGQQIKDMLAVLAIIKEEFGLVVAAGVVLVQLAQLFLQEMVV
jgi:hypothetical protein